MTQKYIAFLASIMISVLCISCEEIETNFGYPSKIGISGKGETITIPCNSDLSPHINYIDLLDYDGDGNGAHATDDTEYLEVTTDWLTVRYYTSDNGLQLIAEANHTQKKRKLYLYLFSGNHRQEITVIQTK